MQQSPHLLQWDTPNSPQNCPFLFDDHHPDLIHKYTHPSTNHTHHPKWHPGPLSRFATVHFPDRQTETDTHTHAHTHTMTDRWSR